MASTSIPESSQRDVRVLNADKTEDQALRSEINRAKQMLETERDDEGPIFSTETLSTAAFFLTAQSNQFRQIFGSFPPAPAIGPGPNASVDIYWKQESWELLVNFPAESNRPATFYGDNYGIQKIKGSLDTKSFNNGIIQWLMNS